MKDEGRIEIFAVNMVGGGSAILYKLLFLLEVTGVISAWHIMDCLKHRYSGPKEDEGLCQLQ